MDGHPETSERRLHMLAYNHHRITAQNRKSREARKEVIDIQDSKDRLHARVQISRDGKWANVQNITEITKS